MSNQNGAPSEMAAMVSSQPPSVRRMVAASVKLTCRGSDSLAHQPSGTPSLATLLTLSAAFFRRSCGEAPGVVPATPGLVAAATTAARTVGLRHNWSPIAQARSRSG